MRTFVVKKDNLSEVSKNSIKEETAVIEYKKENSL